MNNKQKRYFIIGGILIALSIILGAFGAHALKQLLVNFPEKLVSFETGVRYQIYVGFSFLFLGLIESKINVKLIASFWLIGMIFFSLSIYLLALNPLFGINLGFLGPITPIGGLFLIIGWVILVLKLIKHK
ncbi:MAG: DUF423 domain-containing protein [Crocinitomicaceae bacterium]